MSSNIASLGPAVATATGPEPNPKKRRGPLPYFLLAPGMLWLTVFFLVPLGFMFATSLQVPIDPNNPDVGYKPALHWHTYVAALQEYWPIYLRSFAYAGLATLIGLCLAYPLAYFIAQRAGKWRYIMLVLVVAPFFASFLLRTYAWESLLSDNSWVVKIGNLVHINFFNIWDFHLLPQGRILSTPIAVIFGLTYNFLPFMILPLYASIERIDPRLIEAAGDLYARPFTGWRKVTLPLSGPGVISGALLTFIPASGDFINATLLGSVNDRMIGNVIQGQFNIIRDYPTAAALSFILMAVIMVMIAIYIRRAGTEELI
jgi:spermidine/putrescine transport system permease protein